MNYKNKGFSEISERFTEEITGVQLDGEKTANEQEKLSAFEIFAWSSS